MVGLAGALVLNIGTLSPHWVEAMLLAGRAANERGVPVVLDPVGAGATRYRTETAKRILDEVDVDGAARQRRRGGDARRRRGRGARRRVDRRRRRSGRARARGGAHARRRRLGHRAGRPRLRRRARARDRERPSAARVDHRHRLHVERDHRLLPRGRRSRRSTRAAEALVAFGVAGEDAARRREGAGLVPRRALRRARRARPGDARRAGARWREGARDRRRPRDGAARGRRRARRSSSCA